MSNNLKVKIILIAVLFLISPLATKADYLTQQVNFFIDKDYDLSKRNQLVATLQKVTEKLYFYIDDELWNSLNNQKRDEVIQNLTSLSLEFEKNIYPNLTSNFGSEWKPGIDKDEKITILIHPMIEGAGGYFNNGDEYPKLQVPTSNEREMVYLNSKYLGINLVKSFLAHEFMHLITFNQKEKIQGIEEEIWLNEARSEYAPTLLGYDDVFTDSNLQLRVHNFLNSPNDSLTEWKNRPADYGVLNLFTQYLLDHYGIDILIESLHSSKVGIPSINEALQKNGFKEDFSQIFTNWTIAVLVNDCNLGPKYCYLNQNLKKIKVVPQANFLPLYSESSLYILNDTKNWAGNWQKIIGGKGDLTFEFDGDDKIEFKVYYLVCNIQEVCEIQDLFLDKEQKGSFTLQNFNEDYSSVTIIPLIGSKLSGFEGAEPRYFFSWKASTVETPEKREEELIKQLLAQIESLKRQIAETRAKIDEILGGKNQIYCSQIKNNLYFGLMENSEVRCLQEFLKIQGPEVYPEGLITGNFLSLTQVALIRFQEKYSDEILKPLNLEKGTGYVGQMTRAKINELLGK